MTSAGNLQDLFFHHIWVIQDFAGDIGMRITLYALMDSSVWIDANSVDPDEMPYYATFHLGFQCLQLKYKYFMHAFLFLLPPNRREGVHIGQEL